MIFFTHGKHIDLSKIVAISDLKISAPGDYMSFDISFQLMNKPMSFSINHKNIHETKSWIESDGWGTYREGPYTEKERKEGLADLKKFKQDYNRLLNAWIKLNEISKSKNS